MLESVRDFPDTARPWLGLMEQSYEDVTLLEQVHPVAEGMLFVLSLRRTPEQERRNYQVYLCTDVGDVAAVSEKAYATSKGAHDRAMREARDWNRTRYEELMREA